MENEAKTVFGSWVVGESIGSGTDGRVSYIYKQDGNGNKVTGVLKTIFFLENRNETKDYNKIGAVVKNSHSSLEEIVEAVANNIDHIMRIDNGKRFVKYEEYEVRKVKGGFVLYIRLEQMRSLENLLREFSLTESESIQIGLAICRSLVRTRKFSYVYPYLKPENILFTDNGNCKLADFGSFSYLEPSKASIAYKKSECFMAPEFITSGKTNTTCDTYALGLILYMLTNRGRLPFSESYPQPLTPAGLERSKQMRMNGEPLPKPELASDELFEVIKKACAFNVEDRFIHPGQMLEALKAIGTGRTNQEPRYDEVYSNGAGAPAQSRAAAPSSAGVNEYLTSKGMPDQKGVVGAPPSSLNFDDIMRTIENGGVPPKPQAQPAPQPAQPAEQRQAQQPKPQQPKPQRKEEPLPFDGEEDEDEPFFEEYEEETKTNLFDKIKIPSFRPRDYTDGEGGEGGSGKKLGRFFIRDLPQSNDDVANSVNMKKAGIILIAIVLVFVLLIVSCSARAKNKANNAAVTQQQSTEQIAQQDTEPQISNNAEAGEQTEAGENGESEENAERGETSESAENGETSESAEITESGESQIPND